MYLGMEVSVCGPYLETPVHGNLRVFAHTLRISVSLPYPVVLRPQSITVSLLSCRRRAPRQGFSASESRLGPEKWHY